MKPRIRQLIGLIAVVTLVSAGACSQENSRKDGQASTRSIGAGSDQAALTETVVTLLFIARKQARETGECDQGEQRLDRRSDENRALKRLLCNPLARQEAKHQPSEQDLRLKSIASLPKR